MHKTFSPIEYLCIDIANTYGKDKALFEDRIQWVKDNFNQLEQLADEAEEKALYIKAVMALRDVIKGKPTGHLISLDAVCSGIQIMSAITGCMKGGEITGLVNPEKRSDAYTEITIALNEILTQRGLGNVEVTRSKAKDAIMPACYGSREKPIEIFGEEHVNNFYEACHQKAEGAFTLLDILIESWQPYTLAHSWYMPDGHFVHIKTMQTVETKIEIDELNHHKFVTRYKENKGSKRGVALAAHVIHSIDAYVLRSMIRRTNYDKATLTTTLSLLEQSLANKRKVKQVTTEEIIAHSDYFANFQMVDATTFDVITAENVGALTHYHLEALIKLAKDMLRHKPFEMLTVHDAFRMHPNHGNTTRYWYKEILAELCESQILNIIMQQITGINPQFQKLSQTLPHYIRNSNYSLG